MRILLMQGDADSAENLSGLLEEDGHLVAIATTPERAFCDAPAFRPELLISDLHLSGEMDGLATCGIITTSLSLVPVIMMTNHAREYAVLAYHPLGPLAVVQKPVDYAQLSRLIASVRIH